MGADTGEVGDPERERDSERRPAAKADNALSTGPWFDLAPLGVDVPDLDGGLPPSQI